MPPRHELAYLEINLIYTQGRRVESMCLIAMGLGLGSTLVPCNGRDSYSVRSIDLEMKGKKSGIQCEAILNFCH